MAVNALLIPLINKHLSRAAAVFGAMLLLALSFVGLASVRGPASLVCVLLPLVISMATFRAYSVALVSNAVPTEQAGSAIGLSHAAGSLSGVLAPALSGHVFRSLGFESVCYLQAAMVVVASLTLYLNGPLAATATTATTNSNAAAAASQSSDSNLKKKKAS